MMDTMPTREKWKMQSFQGFDLRTAKGYFSCCFSGPSSREKWGGFWWFLGFFLAKALRSSRLNFVFTLEFGEVAPNLRCVALQAQALFYNTKEAQQPGKAMSATMYSSDQEGGDVFYPKEEDGGVDYFEWYVPVVVRFDFND